MSRSEPTPAPAPPAPGADGRRVPLLMLRRGEGLPVALGGLYFFLVMCAYYLLRGYRDALGIEHGVERLPWYFTATLAATLLVNPLYWWLVSRLPRRRFIPLTHGLFAASFLAFGAGLETLPEPARSWLGPAFYVWLSVFVLFAVSVVWAVMADVFASEPSRRVFGLIAMGGTLGAIAGSALAAGWAERIGPAGLLAAAAGLLALGAVPAAWLLRVAPAAGGRVRAGEPSPRVLEGLRLLERVPVLRGVALYLLLFTVTGTFLFVAQQGVIAAAYTDVARRTAFLARVDLGVNLLTLVLQVCATGHILRRLGLAVALAVVPAITLVAFLIVGATGALALPALVVVPLLYALRRAAHYAVDRPGREALFTLLGPDARYKSKSFVDTFVYRAGDQVGVWAAAGLAGTALGVWPVGLALAMGAAVLGVWLGGRAERAGRGPGGAAAAML
ncbi:MAG TPA: MFS transporter [Phycisphaerales bacterium]|nr:MFS transporter [Phycisphaerales bacterium]